MTNPCSASGSAFRCPGKWELFGQLMALLPRGRAWQSDQVGSGQFLSPYSSEFGGDLQLGVAGLGSQPVTDKLSVLEQFWAAFAEVLAFLHLRACALIEEMFCATIAETRNDWGLDYGFPDLCEPWSTLCDKVVSTGGSTCAYLATLAQSLGYVIECYDGCGGGARADCAVADCTPPGCECVPNQIFIRIISSRSPAIQAVTPFHADAVVADCTPLCVPPPDLVVCLIERFKPAHVRAYYEVV